MAEKSKHITRVEVRCWTGCILLAEEKFRNDYGSDSAFAFGGIPGDKPVAGVW